MSAGCLLWSSVHVTIYYPHAGTDDVKHESVRKRDIFSSYQ